MGKMVVSDPLMAELEAYLRKNRKADLMSTYLLFLEKKFHLDPVVFGREKKIYQSEDELVKLLEQENKLWRETEIKIQVGAPTVNSETTRIYICPFSGKVFGDNTHPNPQDAIYDWVSNCKENTERKDGMKVKKFYVSEDPEVIKNYIQVRREPITKTVYTSVVTGKLFNSKKAVVEDFLKYQIKHVRFSDITKQNRFEIEEHFLEFIQKHLDETKISAFVESLSGHEAFIRHIERWTEEQSESSSEADEDEDDQ
ncbi:MAG: DUF2709 domain-containing protein [Chlamydiae bacterium]|nr:DUF2709 domain-containing protein [Chlamydiota bacterium]